MENSSKYRKLCVTNAVIYNDSLWFCSAWYNFLFKCNLKSLEVEKAISLPMGNNGNPSYVVAMFISDDCIYMISNNANDNLMIYNSFTEEMQVIPVKLDNCLIGNFFDEDDEYVYLPVVDKKRIIEIKKKDLSVKFHAITCQGNGIQLVKKINGGFVFLETNVGDVVITDESFREKKRVKDKPAGFEVAYDNYYPGVGLICFGDEVSVIPRYANMVYSVDISNGKARQRGEMYDEYENVDDNGPRFSFVRRMGDRNWLFSNEENTWIIVDDNLSEIERVKIKLSEEVDESLNSINILKGNSGESLMFIESRNVFTLNNYIKGIASL